MFAYFDESGKFQDSDFICIAGFVSDDARWNVFAEQWDRLLKTYKIPALHMRHVMPLKGPFEGWDREQAKKMLGEFIGIIRRNVFIGLGVGMDTKYLRSMPSDVRKQIGDPQYFCFQRILRLLVKKVEKIGYKSSVPITFDDTEEHAVRCYRMWSKLRKLHPELKQAISAITFADDEIFYPLQGADLLAHQTRDHQLRMASGRGHSQHFENLVTPIGPETGIHYDSEFWNKDMLDDIHAQFQRGDVLRIA